MGTYENETREGSGCARRKPRARPARRRGGKDASMSRRRRRRKDEGSAPTHRGVVAIVGRPNVGKSALFNRLTRTRRALVHRTSGVTRDRLYGEVRLDGGENFTVVDTGGVERICDATPAVKRHIKEQVEYAIAESDVILFVVDGRSPLTEDDYFCAQLLTPHRRRTILVVNKIDDVKLEELTYQFHELGFEHLVWVSAVHGLNVEELLEKVDALLPPPGRAGALEQGTADTASVESEYGGKDPWSDAWDEGEDEGAEVVELDRPLKVCVAGRPNVGKSSLINTLIRTRRLVVDDTPGTTTCPVDVRVKLGGLDMILVDTAGIRRKSRVDEELERLSAATARGVIESSDIVLLMLEAHEPRIPRQDKRISGYILEAYKAGVIVLNKWDLVEDREGEARAWPRRIKDELGFMDYFPHVFVSALSGFNMKLLVRRIEEVSHNALRRIPTPRLNRLIRDACLVHPPPSYKGRRLRIKYAAQLRNKVATFVFKVNDTQLLHFSFVRYLENTIRENYHFEGVPLKFIFEDDDGRRTT